MTGDWAGVAAACAQCRACPELAEARTSVVVGEAPPGARLALVGEAPGAAEDASGRPFVGRAGQVLDGVLAEVGLGRDAVAVLNVLKCRPPGNRRPTPVEVERCRPWLTAQLDLLAPGLVCPLGATATAWFLGRRLGGTGRLGDVRGRVHEVGGWRVLPTLHPSGAMRSGPVGEPMRLLRADLALAARLSGAL